MTPRTRISADSGCFKPQRGFVTLITSLLLLFLITLVTLFSANMAVVEQQVSGNQYRSEQALAAADAGMDWALNYLDEGGIDQDGDGEADCIATDYCVGIAAGNLVRQSDNATANFYTYVSDAPTSRVFFCESGTTYGIEDTNDTCTAPASDAEELGVVSIGFSDDNSGYRIVKQEIKSLTFMGDGPKNSISTPSIVDLSGNIRVINRYFNITVWSGQPVTTWGSSDSFIRNPDYYLETADVASPNDGKADDRTLLTDAAISNEYTSLASSQAWQETNLDVIDGDVNLKNLMDEPEMLFRMIFNGYTKETFEEAADSYGQRYDNTDGDSANDWPPSGVDTTTLQGYIYIKGENVDLGDLGSVDTSALIVVDGSMRLGANDNIYGLVYVSDPDSTDDNDGNGDFGANGNGVLKGALVVEGKVSGNGGPTIVYDPDAFGSSGLPVNVARVSSTWMDW